MDGEGGRRRRRGREGRKRIKRAIDEGRRGESDKDREWEAEKEEDGKEKILF